MVRLVMAAESDLRTVLSILAEAAMGMRDERGIRDQWSPVVPEGPFAQAIRDGSALGRDVIRLDCVASNRGLRGFYEGLGFASRGTITRWHEDGRPWTAARYQRPARA